jgi:hypothetical protein
MCFVRFLPCNHKRITSGMGRNYNHMSDGPSLGLGNRQLEKLTGRCNEKTPSPPPLLPAP